AVLRSETSAGGGYCELTTAVAGRSRAPGPGRPVTWLIKPESVWAMQKVPAKTPPVVSPGMTGVPVREMTPPPLVGKQGTLVVVAQQSCEMPPWGSRQRPCESWLTQAEPVQPALQVPAPQLSSWVWGPEESGQGSGPFSSLAVPVVRGSSMSS